MRSIAVMGFGLSVCIFLVSCSPQEQQSQKLSQLMDRLEGDQLTIEEKTDLLFLQFTEAENHNWVVSFYEKHRADFSRRLKPSLYYAAALSSLAGAAEEINDQLTWVRKGIAEFDRLSMEYPDDPQLLLWRSITYSNFPQMLGMNYAVEDDLTLLTLLLREGMELTPGEYRIVYEAWRNLASEYSEDAYLARARSFAEEFNVSSN